MGLVAFSYMDASVASKSTLKLEHFIRTVCCHHGKIVQAKSRMGFILQHKMPICVLDFGRYQGKTYAQVYRSRQSYMERSTCKWARPSPFRPSAATRRG